ncbi:MAG: MoaD/ThiS family protein [Deltaproteobacteria bacterium]|nr:MoaD/ThiS family protein [Deltaproteobacteria bacterium]
MGADVKARIKLLGTLPSYFAGSYSASGIEVTLPDNATVAAVVEILGIPKERLGIITINGTLARAFDSIPDDAEVKLFQRIAGG